MKDYTFLPNPKPFQSYTDEDLQKEILKRLEDELDEIVVTIMEEGMPPYPYYPAWTDEMPSDTSFLYMDMLTKASWIKHILKQQRNSRM